MSRRFEQLSARHSNLLARCAVQRRQLAESAEEIEHELGRVDRGLAVIRGVLRSPLLLGGAVAVVALIGPRRLLRWSTKGLMLYSTTRQIMGTFLISRTGSGQATDPSPKSGMSPIRRESAATAPMHDGG